LTIVGPHAEEGRPRARGRGSGSVARPQGKLRRDFPPCPGE
jgi:hypothetical protein